MIVSSKLSTLSWVAPSYQILILLLLLPETGSMLPTMASRSPWRNPSHFWPSHAICPGPSGTESEGSPAALLPRTKHWTPRSPSRSTHGTIQMFSLLHWSRQYAGSCQSATLYPHQSFLFIILPTSHTELLILVLKTTLKILKQVEMHLYVGIEDVIN
jgi:hypothetical protein